MRPGMKVLKAFESHGFAISANLSNFNAKNRTLSNLIEQESGLNDLVVALDRLEVSVTEFCNLNGISGDLSARLSDARAVLKKAREE